MPSIGLSCSRLYYLFHLGEGAVYFYRAFTLALIALPSMTSTLE